jgi:hypothetical protein
MKIFFLLLLATTSFAQTHSDTSKKLTAISFKNFTVAYFATSDYGINHGFQTCNGVQLSSYFYAGLGIGYDCYRDPASGFVDDKYKYLPLFLNVRGLIPLNRVTPFISLSYGRDYCIYYGYYRGVVDNPSAYSGNFFDAVAGFSLPVYRSLSFIFDLGYKTQSNIYYQTNLNSALIETGISF